MIRAQSGASLLRFMGADPLPSDLTPWVPANDFSGVVKAAGVDSGYKVGDEVYGMKPFGPVDGEFPRAGRGFGTRKAETDFKATGRCRSTSLRRKTGRWFRNPPSCHSQKPLPCRWSI